MIFTSFGDVSSFVSVDPTKHLNWSASSTTSPFIQDLVDSLGLMLLATTLLLSVMISIPYPSAVSSGLSVSFGVLLPCPQSPAGRCRQQTASCTAVIIRWTRMEVECPICLLGAVMACEKGRWMSSRLDMNASRCLRSVRCVLIL